MKLYKKVKNKIINFAREKTKAAVNEVVKKGDEILNKVLITSCISVYISILTIIWINVSLGLKTLATAIITILATIIIILTTKGNEEGKNQ